MSPQFLYPPLAETYAPAFVQTNSCKIYFSKTLFNNPNDLAPFVHVAITYVKTNRSALIPEWQTQIMFAEIKTDNSIVGDYKYYIEISPSNLDGGIFATGQYYKVQIRFNKNEVISVVPLPSAPYTTAQSRDADWFKQNVDYFSEWSRPILIKGIPEPLLIMQEMPIVEDVRLVAIYDYLGITVNDLENMGQTYNAGTGFNLENTYVYSDFFPGSAPAVTLDYWDTNTFTVRVNRLFNTKNIGVKAGYEDMMFAGHYSNTDSEEVLHTYEATLYEKQTDGSYLKVGETGLQYTDNVYQNGAGYVFDIFYNPGDSIYNGFEYHFDTLMKDCIEYKLEFVYTTKNGYTNKSNPAIYTFTTALLGTAIFQDLEEIQDKVVVNNEEGSIEIPVRTTNPISGDFIIRRADDKSIVPFGTWEPLYQDYIETPTNLDFTFTDLSAESGVLYKYWVGGKELSAPIMLSADHIFLVGQNKQQLKVAFNPEVSSFRYVVNESRTDTLGGKYPFIRRNGNTKYREFSLTGLISLESDTAGLFTTDSAIYRGYTQDYKTNAQVYGDQILERKFRDAVMDFLYDGQVKLYKSVTEGNILVRLMDINFTPQTALGRSLYNFSATAIEVDDFSIDNCSKYGIQVISNE